MCRGHGVSGHINYAVMRCYRDNFSSSFSCLITATKQQTKVNVTLALTTTVQVFKLARMYMRSVFNANTGCCNALYDVATLKQ